MIRNSFKQIHETFTDETNCFIKLDDLLDNIKTLTLEEQTMLLMQTLAISESKNEEYIKVIKEQENFSKKRSGTTSKKQRVISKKKVLIEQKKHFCEAMCDHEEEIRKIIKLNYGEFIEYVYDKKDNNINYLKLGLIREITSYNRLADDAYFNKDKDLITEIQVYINELSKKLSFLKNMEFIDCKKSDKKLCRIIFLETSSLKPYFMKDIAKLEEFYASFAKLFESIEEGTPRKAKTFSNNGNLNGLIEARDVDHQTRIFFDKIDDQTYVIINAIIKKDNKTCGYLTQISGRYKFYQLQKPQILEQMYNEDFIKRQEKHLNIVKAMLGLLEPTPQITKNLKRRGF